MTDSAVLDTILGLIFLFYALALLCGGLVEMIANWVKKRAKYLLRGIRDLLDDVVQADVAYRTRRGGCRPPPRLSISTAWSRGSAMTKCFTRPPRARRGSLQPARQQAQARAACHLRDQCIGTRSP